LWEAWPQHQNSALGKLWRAAMTERMPASLEQLSERPWRDPLWLEVRVYPSGDGIAVFYRDVTNRKKSEEELKRTQTELIHASRVTAMGAMASTLAHELSQPLASVSNYLEAVQTILRPLPPAQIREARQAVGLAAASTHRASEILRRLRRFVTRGQVETSVHDLQMIVADACVLLVPHAQREGVEIRFQLDRYARWVQVDAIQIQQVLINLVKNAIEAMATAETKLVTVASARLDDGNVAVSVSDTGPGLDDGEGSSLFAPLESGKAGGMGLGLSISRTIVEAHGGTIEMERPSQGGALFRFTLPRGRQPSQVAA
jgi:two-component system sensor kinase FixL